MALRQSVTARAAAYFDQMLRRRVSGEPLQYVLGHWSFRTLDLMVDRRVLIPRPETEQVVEVALGELDRMGASPRLARQVSSPRAVDLGTGSGAIALALATERPRVRLWASDLSADALAVASANLAGLASGAAQRVRLVRGSWWSALPQCLQGGVDLAVSNPPYLSVGEMAGLPASVRDWEPETALLAGPWGTEDLEHVVNEAPAWLAPGGALVVEIAPHQAAVAVDSARRSGLTGTAIRPDLAGRDRILVAYQS